MRGSLCKGRDRRGRLRKGYTIKGGRVVKVTRSTGRRRRRR